MVGVGTQIPRFLAVCHMSKRDVIKNLMSSGLVGTLTGLVYRVIIVLIRQTCRLDVFVEFETLAELENGDVVFRRVVVVHLMLDQTLNVDFLLRAIRTIPHAEAAWGGGR